jgi:hypothetical protein
LLHANYFSPRVIANIILGRLPARASQPDADPKEPAVASCGEAGT